MKKFSDLGLCPLLLRNVAELGWYTPTLVYYQAIPLILASRDVLVQANTGTGKTGAFLLPIINRIYQLQTNHVSAIILSPTRDLAEQTFRVAQTMANGLASVVLITPAASVRTQEILLQQNPQIIVCTPGRLLDHLKNNQHFTIYEAEHLVLDECDKMLELGFLSELKEIISMMQVKRQTMLFSATATAVKEIAGYALQKEIMVKVDAEKSVGANIYQEFVIINNFMGLLDEQLKSFKLGEKYIIKCVLCYHFLSSPEFSGKRILVFCNYKNYVRMVHHFLKQLGVDTLQITGDLTTSERQDIMRQFTDSGLPLITTDLLARGIDIEEVDLVIQYYLSTADTYIHRSGRTGRAGNSGVTISLAFRKEIEELTKQLAKMRLKERVVDQGRFAKLLAQVDAELLEAVNAQLKEDQLNKQEQELLIYQHKIENMELHADEILQQKKRVWTLDTREKRILQDLQKQIKTGAMSETEARYAIMSKGLKDEQRKLNLIAENQKKRSKSAKAKMSQELLDKIKRGKLAQRELQRAEGAAMRKDKKGRQ